MQSTNQLIEEHKGISSMLVNLEKICERLESGDRVEINHLESILEFLQIFVDKCHHGKEEGLLFPLLEKKGIPNENGPIGMMLMEHEEGRKLVRNLGQGIEDYKDQKKEAEKRIIENSRQYVDLLSSHIGKENNILFPMADEVLSQEEDEELINEFEELETQKIGVGKHEEFHKLIDSLQKIYL